MMNFKIKFLKYFSIFFLFILLAGGCGYTMRTLLPAKYRNIYIEPFKNKTAITEETRDAERLRVYFPLLETKITNALINRFIYDGNLRVVRKQNANLILKGELVSYRRDPLRYDSDREIEEYRLNIIVDISLWDTETNELIWEEEDFIGDTTYFRVGAQAKTEDTAIEDAITDVVRRIVERTVENW